MIRAALEVGIAMLDPENQPPQWTVGEALRFLREARSELDKETVGQRIRRARERAGLTQTEVGRVMSKPRSHAAISGLEKGKTHLRVDELCEIAGLLHVSPCALLIGAVALAAPDGATRDADHAGAGARTRGEG